MTLGLLSKITIAAYVQSSYAEHVIHTTGLRNAATKAGWPKKAVNGLSMSISDGAYSPQIAPDVKPLVDELTYGSSSKQPSHVILNYMRTIGVS